MLGLSQLYEKHINLRDGREQFEGMDLLRSIASLMIVVFHAHSIAFKHIDKRIDHFLVLPTWWYGCIELFFVMSVFLMVHMSYRLYGKKGGVKEFFFRRLARTPPLYYVYTMIVLFIFLLFPQLQDGAVTFLRVICSITFFPYSSPPIIAIGWTLNYEVFFYIIVGASIFFPYPIGTIVAMTIIAAFVGIGIIIPKMQAPMSLWTDPLLLNFCAGMGLAMIYYSGWSLTARGRLIGAVLAGTLLFVGSTQIDAGDQMSRILVLTPSITFFVAFFTLRTVAYRLPIAENLIKSFSLRTYTLYLCHILALKVVEKIYFSVFSSIAAAYIFVVIGSLIAIACAYVLYPLIEEPLGRWCKSLISSRRTSQP